MLKVTFESNYKIKEGGYMELVGRVLWYSDRDENGIVVDSNGREFYFDRSVLRLDPDQQIKRNLIISFNHNKTIRNCLCACNIKVYKQ